MRGTPAVPWTQNSASARWTHSDQAPDHCQHAGTDHAVTTYLTVTNSADIAVICTVVGTEMQTLKNPACRAP